MSMNFICKYISYFAQFISLLHVFVFLNLLGSFLWYYFLCSLSNIACSEYDVEAHLVR